MSNTQEQQEPKSVVIPTEVYKAVLNHLGQMPFNQVANLVTNLTQTVRGYVEPVVMNEPDNATAAKEDPVMSIKKPIKEHKTKVKGE
jgi:hypothetical protein